MTQEPFKAAEVEPLLPGDADDGAELAPTIEGADAVHVPIRDWNGYQSPHRGFHS